MTTFLKVPDKIVELSNNEIQMRRLKPYVPIFFIVVGAVFIWGGGFELSLHQVEAIYMTVLGAILVIGGIAFLLSRRRYYTLKRTGKMIKPRRLNLYPDEQKAIVDLMHANKLNEVLKYTSGKNSPLKLEIWYHKSHNKVYSQVLHYHDAGMRAVTLVHVSSYSDLDLPYKNR